MNFSNLMRIHKNIENKYPHYQQCLERYNITKDEETNQKINLDNIQCHYL